MTTFTDKELIKEIKERIGRLDVRDNIERRAYEIALALLEAEPVAYQYRQWDAEYDEWGEWEDCGECAFEWFVEEEKCQGAGVQTRKLYAAPPVSVTPGGWISCSERMPDEGETVLGCCGVNGRYSGIYTMRASVINRKNSSIDTCGIKHERVTHWMPLPEPPQEVNRG